MPNLSRFRPMPTKTRDYGGDAAHKLVIARPESSRSGHLEGSDRRTLRCCDTLGELRHDFVRSCNKTSERGNALFMPPLSASLSPLPSVSGHVAAY